MRLSSATSPSLAVPAPPPSDLHLRDALRLPGWISGIRVTLAVAFPFVVRRTPVALAFIASAAATDVLDGWVARRRHEESAMGALLDGVADKLFVGAVVVGLVAGRRIALADAALLCTREIVEGATVAWGLVRRAPAGRDRRANALGKVTTSLQLVTASLALLRLRHRAPLLGAAVTGVLAGVSYAARERRAAGVGPAGARPFDIMPTVHDIMSSVVLTFSPEMRIARAAALLADRQVSGGPVCEDDGRVVGVLSQSDLTDVFGAKSAKIVRDVMTPEVLSVRASEPMEAAIRAMAFEGVHRLVVVDGEGRLAGIVTSMDVLRALAGFPRDDRRSTAIAPPDEPPRRSR